MRLNQFTRLIGEKIVLVPYEKEHVPKYHQWMTDPELQLATASEPLTLEDEYTMQKTWRSDDDKLTFIILDKENYEQSGKDEVASMVGDVNLFIYEEGAEVEIMIGEKGKQGKGFGSEAVKTILGYALVEYNRDIQFTAKIGYDNESSIRLFTCNFGFVEENRSEVFREISYRLPLACHDRFRDFYMEKVRKEQIKERNEVAAADL